MEEVNALQRALIKGWEYSAQQMRETNMHMRGANGGHQRALQPGTTSVGKMVEMFDSPKRPDRQGQPRQLNVGHQVNAGANDQVREKTSQISAQI
jgi:hypothetical protein